MFKSKFEMVGVLALAGMIVGGALLTIAIYSVPAVESNYTELSLSIINETGNPAIVRVEIGVTSKGNPIDEEIVVPTGPRPAELRYPRIWARSHPLTVRVSAKEVGPILAREIRSPVGALSLHARIPKDSTR